jgi:hypothetical protein
LEAFAPDAQTSVPHGAPALDAPANPNDASGAKAE